MSTLVRKSINAGLTALAIGVAASTLAPTSASAFGMGGFGHMGGFGQMGGVGHIGGFGQMGGVGHIGGLGQMGGVAHMGGLSRASGLEHVGSDKSAGLGMSKSVSNDRPVGGGMYEKAGTGTTPNGDRPVGGGMYEKAGTGTTPNGDRPVGGGMYEKAGTGTTPNGDRPVGGGMYEKAGTGTTPNGDRPVGAAVYEKAGTGTTPNGDRPVGGGMYEKAGTGTADKTDTRKTANGEGDKSDADDKTDRDHPHDGGGHGDHSQISVSYGSTPETGIVLVDDLPKNAARVQNDCKLLQDKVAYLINQLARQFRVLAALQGAQNVAYSDKTTDVATSFASPEDAQAAIDRISSDIADTQQLLARYQVDLARCLAAH